MWLKAQSCFWRAAASRHRMGVLENFDTNARQRDATRMTEEKKNLTDLIRDLIPGGAGGSAEFVLVDVGTAMSVDGWVSRSSSEHQR